MKKIIKLTESDILKIAKIVLSEQTAQFTGGRPQSGLSTSAIVEDLEDYMNVTLLKEVQNEAMNNFTITVEESQQEGFNIRIKSLNGLSEDIVLETQNAGRGLYVALGRGVLTVGKYPTSQLIEKIEQNPNFAKLLASYPKYKQQIIDGFVDVNVILDGRQSGFYFTIYETKGRGFQLGAGFPFGDWYDANKAYFQLDKKLFGELSSRNITLDMGSFAFMPEMPETGDAITGNTTSETGSTPTVVSLNFQLVDAFKFDEDNFVDEKNAMGQIDQLAQYIITNTNKFGKELVDHIMKSKPQIIGYASIDGNPNDKITGKYGACKSRGTRKDYNKCLSEFRAQKIATLLNQKLSGTGITIGFVGAGETTNFGPGWSPTKPTTIKQTAPNRRFILSQIPPFSKTIK